MSYTDFKEITTNNPGSSAKYGGDDTKELMQIYNGKVVASRRPKILNEWIWLDHFDMKAPGAAPSAPTDTNTNRFYTDPSDFKVKIKKTGGAIVDIENIVQTLFSSLGFSKVSTPADPPTEEALLYFKQITTDYNGLFIKGKKNSAIAEEQIFPAVDPFHPLYAKRVVGYWHPNSPQATGIFSGVVVEEVAGSSTMSLSEDSTYGPFRRYAIANISGQRAELITYSRFITARKFFPRFTTRFRISSTIGNTYNMYIVLISNPTDGLTGSTDLNTDNGIGLIHRTTQANFEVVSNDGNANQLNTIFDSAASATDGLIHTFTLETINDSPGSFRITLDAQSKTVTSQVPGSTNFMALGISVESQAATAFDFDLWPIIFDMNRT